jgi:hypothetical protein
MIPNRIKQRFDGGKKGILPIMYLCCAFLSACGNGDRPHTSFVPPPPVLEQVAEAAGVGITIPVPFPEVRASERAAAARAGRPLPDPTALGFSANNPPIPGDCSVKDRFDTTSALSFLSEDGRKELALNVRTSGTSVNAAMLRFRYQFDDAPRKTKGRAECRFPSRVQGLVGSAYHELIVRDQNTVWHQFKSLKVDLLP